MTATDTLSVYDNYQRRMNGKPFYSPAPRELDLLPTYVIDKLKNDTVKDKYREIREVPGVTSELSKLYESNSELHMASALVSFYANDAEPELRMGMFGPLHEFNKDQYNKDRRFHTDTFLTPSSIIICAIGRPTSVMIGEVIPESSGIGVKLAPTENCEIQSLKEGYIYRMEATTVHAEPLPPEMPEMRYFWRATSLL